MILVQQNPNILAALQFQYKRFVPQWTGTATNQLRLGFTKVMSVKVNFNANEKIGRLLDAGQSLNGEIQIAHKQCFISIVAQQIRSNFRFD